MATSRAKVPFARLDFARKARTGFGETVFGPGKTPEQLASIFAAFAEKRLPVLATRVTPEQAEAVLAEGLKAKYHPAGRLLIAEGEKLRAGKKRPRPMLKGTVAVLTGGTADIPVAEEAAVTAETYGNRVVRVYDVGVAGLHRTLAHMDDIMSAKVIIAIAGMEGALASVIGGLAECPVIAVPTSVGYGASFHGLSALLSMLNSCASGVSVVNIDNGFGAAYQASLINHMR